MFQISVQKPVNRTHTSSNLHDHIYSSSEFKSKHTSNSWAEYYI